MDLLRDPRGLENIPDENIGMQTENESLMVLPAGSGEAQLDLLYSEAMGSLMRRLRRGFDAVLIDTPAIMHLVDARVLGSLADGVILVLRADKTDRDDALQARQRFVQDGIPVLGAILNDWRPGSKPYSYYTKGQSRAS
jgi:Mrp family chromosome partitioning ATPase